MRQWHLPVEMLCDKHLRGEHVEHHMFAAQLQNGKSISGYLMSPSGERLLWPGTLKSRHDQIAKEMVARGDKHVSEFTYAEPDAFEMDIVRFGANWQMELRNNVREVARRCPGCRQRIENLGFGPLLDGVPVGGDYYGVCGEGTGMITVFISGKLVGRAPTKAKAVMVMEKLRRRMRLDGSLWE